MRVFLCGILGVSIAGWGATDPLDWRSLLQEAWKVSPDGRRAELERQDAETEYELAQRRWYPQAGFASSELVEANHPWGNLKGIGAEPRVVVGQALPGRGKAVISAGYHVEWGWNPVQVRQTPLVTLSLRQPLGPGVGGVDDPDQRTAITTWYRSQIVHRKTANEALSTALGLAKKLDLAHREVLFQEALEKEARARLSLSGALSQQGRLAPAEMTQASRQTKERQRTVAKARFDEGVLVEQWSRTFGARPPSISHEDGLWLLQLVSESRVGSSPWDLELLQNELDLISEQARLEDLQEAPVISFSGSLQPDAMAHFFEKSWEASWNSIRNPPVPWSVGVSLGLEISFDPYGAASLRHEAANRKTRQILGNIEDLTRAKPSRIRLLELRMQELKVQLEDLDFELDREKITKEGRDYLYARGELTEDQFWEGEAQNLALLRDQSAVLWELILTQVEWCQAEGRDLAAEILS